MGAGSGGMAHTVNGACHLTQAHHKHRRSTPARARSAHLLLGNVDHQLQQLLHAIVTCARQAPVGVVDGALCVPQLRVGDLEVQLHLPRHAAAVSRRHALLDVTEVDDKLLTQRRCL